MKVRIAEKILRRAASTDVSDLADMITEFSEVIVVRESAEAAARKSSTSSLPDGYMEPLVDLELDRALAEEAINCARAAAGMSDLELADDGAEGNDANFVVEEIDCVEAPGPAEESLRPTTTRTTAAPNKRRRKQKGP